MPAQYKWILSFTFFTLIALPNLSAAQQVPEPTLNDILNRAADETKKYIEAFKNLLSEESKTIETFDKQGTVKKKKTIRSTFLVYQLTKDQNQSTEFRNVVAVDGKLLEDADRRAQDFFTKVVRAESSKKELQELRKESSRYDGDLVISGMTLFQSPILSEKLRPFFDFTLNGRSSVDGTEVYEVSYLQKTQTPMIQVNVKGDSEPGGTFIEYDVDSDVHGDLNGRLRGKLWIDVSTFQVRREHRELTVQPENAISRLPAIVNDFDFQASDFGILTPKKITHIQSRIRSKGEPPIKEMQVTMDYSNFTRPDVEVKSSEVKSPPKP